MNKYSFEVSAVDVSVAFSCEADRAKKEQFPNVEKRQRENALHVDNAVHHMKKICPEGFRVKTEIVVSHVPDVNPVLREEYR